MLGLDDLHLFQTFQHAPQVRDAILKGDFLIVAWVGILEQFPHIYVEFFLLRLLVPASQRGQDSNHTEGEKAKMGG